MRMKVVVFQLLLVWLQCNHVLSMKHSFSSSESHLFLHELSESSQATTTTTIQQLPLQRFLNENEEDKNENNGEDDDYFSLDEDSMLDFSGFSLKYAKCQTIQRFSEDAIKNGEYSAMVKEDIVILRLCPNSQCTSNKQYGCRYNYLEYAISLFDYLKFMLKYTIDKKSKLCDFCQSCGYFSNNNNNNRHHQRRRTEGEEDQQDEANNERQQEGEDQAEDNNENNNNNQQEGNANQDNNAAEDADAQGDDATNDNEDDATSTSESSICESYSTTCSQTESFCLNGGAASFATVDDDDTASSSSSSSSSKLPYNDYFDYLGCVKIVSNGANYWIRPRCDPYKDNIHMDIYYDPYCSQYAGNDVNLREVSGINFQQSVFTPYYNGTCIDCSSSDDPPYYNAKHLMCNKVHTSSAMCTKQLMYQFDPNYDTSSNRATQECSFIESVRVGTYNQKGEIYVDSSVYGSNGEKSGVKMEVTPAQQAGLSISILLCVVLGVYSCYLHHSITNLLIKSLSHSHLLPPSRHRSRRKHQQQSPANNANSTRGVDDDWDHSVGRMT